MRTAVVMALVWNFGVNAHKPGFATSSSAAHTFPETELSQVEYRPAGTHAFKMVCQHQQKIFWEVVIPNNADGAMHIHIEDDSDMFDSNQFMYAEPHTELVDQSITVMGCPFKRYREPFTATGVGTVARYGSTACDPGTHATVEVASAVPFGFVVGEKESIGKLAMHKMPYYYAKVGKVFYNTWCPWTWASIAWLAYLFACAAAHTRPDAHTAIGIGWVVFIFLDICRLGTVLQNHPDNTCPASGTATGPETHPDTDNGTAAVWWIHGFVRIILLMGLCGMVPWLIHTQAWLCKSWSDRGKMYCVLGLALPSMLTSWWLAAGGLGLYPIVIGIYYIADYTKMRKVNKVDSTADRFMQHLL
jgi:hypothetical protein